MSIGTICSRRPTCIAQNASLSEVVALMHQERVGTVIVTRTLAGRPIAVGIITDRDIVRAQLAQIADFSQLSTADTMTRDPLVLPEDKDIADALALMRTRGVRRAPVTDATGALIGIVSTDDLLAQIARDVGGLAGIIARQSGRNA